MQSMEVRVGDLCHGGEFYGSGEVTGPVRIFANAKERDRTNNVNTAFSRLRTMIPTQPADRKLSKIETLRLACSYITHLDTQLATGNTNSPCMRETRPGAGRILCTFCLAEQRLQKQQEAARAARTTGLQTGPAPPPPTYGSAPEPGPPARAGAGAGAGAVATAGAGVGAGVAEPARDPFGFSPMTAPAMFFPGLTSFAHEFGR